MGRKRKNKNEDEDNSDDNFSDKKPKRRLAGDVKRSIVAVVLFSLAILSVLGFLSLAGTGGKVLNQTIAYLIGWVKFIFPVFLIIFGIVLLLRKETSFYVTKLIGLTLSLLAISGFFHWFYASEKMLDAAKAGLGGGYVGYSLDYILAKFLGNAGSLVVILAFFALGMILAFDFSIMHFLSDFRKKEDKDELEESASIPEEAIPGPEISPKPDEITAIPTAPVQNSAEMEAEKNIGHIEFVDGRDQYVDSDVGEKESSELDFSRKKLDSLKSIDSGGSGQEYEMRKKGKSSKWIFPPADHLEKSFGTAQGGDIEKNFSIIEKTLSDFGIKVERGGVKTGPSVTQYSFRPAVGVKIAKILSLQNDLSLALAAHPIRIEAPIPGQSLIGIEIPNKVSLTVRLRDMIEEGQFRRRATNLTLALGEDVSGSCIFGDLSKMPHLMIAGATGTGKSVCINTIITTLLYQNSPDDLKFIMVDPKRVELSLYNGIPHLLTGVVVENGKVVNVLRWAVGEMERRYKLLQESGSRDISSYREKMRAGKKARHIDLETGKVIEEDLKNLPFIVIVIDELADLMGSHGKEVEAAIVRIAQMARAVGIHLIVSTQRPSVEVITGLIKANITTRIAFQVATQIDSRTILDMGGAEKLLGAGDMLYLSASSPKPKRIQGVFVSESEVKRVVQFIKDQKNKDEEDEGENITESAPKEIQEFKSEEEAGDDDLLKAAKEEIVRSKKASASFLQRRLRIGYARAARMLDILEEQGVVGPADGAKPREVYMAEKKQETGYAEPIEDQEKRDKWDI